ncbi:MAG TPA: sigma-70 family RNA polymerase sigma factor [Rhodopila sp.]|nr:sigma-70 family RNA polymerase sigma factor [Rhodopila sp.]
MHSTATLEFQNQLISLLPRMRGWALALTRNAAAADDLVQEAVVRALARHDSFTMGSHSAAWMHRIMLNHFISGIRSRHEFTSVEEIPEVPVAAEQHGKIDCDELSNAFENLPEYQKEVLRQIVLEDRTYEDVSLTSGCAVGTLKSRVHRARTTLRAHMEGTRALTV